jgi:hypothetical protein
MYGMDGRDLIDNSHRGNTPHRRNCMENQVGRHRGVDSYCDYLSGHRSLYNVGRGVTLSSCDKSRFRLRDMVLCHDRISPSDWTTSRHVDSGTSRRSAVLWAASA